MTERDGVLCFLVFYVYGSIFVIVRLAGRARRGGCLCLMGAEACERACGGVAENDFLI